MKYQIALMGIVFTLSGWAESANRILVPPDAHSDYQEFIGDRDPLEVTDFSGPGSSRRVAEMVLMQQAIAEAEVDIPIEFVPESSSEAIVEALSDGTALATGTTHWLSDLAPIYHSVRISTALLSRGDFDVGIYVHPDSIVDGDSEATLRQISTREWQRDWQRLEEAGFEALVHWDAWESQVAAVREGEYSFLIAPFQGGEDMTLEIDGRRLAPVPGVKVGLAGSRHLAVSRSHDEGAFFNSALQLGLLRLKEQGVVEQAYIDVGFLQPQVDDWYRIEVSETFPEWRIE